MLAPGREATIWIFDRFTSTPLDEWRRTSLLWELLWLDDPHGIAEKVGVCVEVLEERPTSELSILDALKRRLSGEAGDDPLIEGMSAFELVERVVSLIRSGHLTRARDLCRRAIEVAPRNLRVGRALAFCSIPLNPVEARRLLARDSVRGGDELVINLANVLTTFLVQGDYLAAKNIQSDLSQTCGETSAWLWEPESLNNPGCVGRVSYVSVKEWLTRI